MGTCQILSQMRPPTPTFTEKECHDLSGKVFIITGGYSGVGLNLAKILYQKNGTIYIAGRSQLKGDAAASEIRAEYPKSNGRVEFLYLDLNDLRTVKLAVNTFLEKEQQLHVLWNNAGVMTPPKGSKTEQGYEMQLGCNCLAHFLFTTLLYPILARTSRTSLANSVRICWTGSLVAELSTPKNVIHFEDINFEKGGSKGEIYGQSKAGNILLALEFARRHADDGVLSIALNPGNLKSGLQRYTGDIQSWFNDKFILYPAIFGAYTELFAGISPEIDARLNGAYIIPWGRVAKLTGKLDSATKTSTEGGESVAARFYDWCEDEVKSYVQGE